MIFQHYSAVHAKSTNRLAARVRRFSIGGMLLACGTMIDHRMIAGPTVIGDPVPQPPVQTQDQEAQTNEMQVFQPAGEAVPRRAERSHDRETHRRRAVRSRAEARQVSAPHRLRQQVLNSVQAVRKQRRHDRKDDQRRQTRVDFPRDRPRSASRQRRRCP